jgi:plasmid maintenance system killer protein
MVMIKSFKDALTEAVANGEIRKGFPADLIKVARRKLGYLNAATTLERSIPDLLYLDGGGSKRR